MERGNRVALYGRVSAKAPGSVDGGRARSVDEQLTELRAWAAATGCAVIAELRDDGISASRFAHGKARPGWQQLLELLAAGRIDAVAVWEVSRASRDRAVWAALLAGLLDAGARLVVDGREHDPADPDDGFMLDLAGALAVRESAMVSKRVTRNVAARAAAGEPHGPVAYGLRIEYDPDSGRPVRRVVDEEHASIVREAARRILGGESPTAVANDLNRRGVPTPAGRPRWVGNNLLRTIAAPALAGLRVHRGRVVDGVEAQWPAVLTVDEHRGLQAVLHDPTRRTVRNGSHVRHLLSGVARCGVCGGPIGTITRRRVRDRVVIYRCRARFCVSRNADELDAYVSDLVVGRLSMPDAVEALAASADDPAVAAAAQEVARLRARLDEARRLVADDRLSLESLADLEARTLPRLRAAETWARPRHIPEAVFSVAGNEAAARWEGLSVATQRQVIRALMDVRLARSPRRGAGSPFHPESVEVSWRA